jgi:lipopolysaccharide export system permease protein
MLFGSTLNRMIFAELVKVFLMALGSLTGLFLLVGPVPQAVSLGLSFGQVAAIIPLFVPSTLPYTIPATTLFASCVVYGRLAHDNEVVAIKGAGVHLFTILKPALLLGVITTCATGGLHYSVIGTTQQRLQEEILRDPEEVLYNALRREKCIRHPNSPYVLYVSDVQGRRLIDVVLKRRTKLTDPKTGTEAWSGYDFVARAREARLRVDAAEGMLYIDPDRFVIYDKNTQGTTASNGPFPVPLPENLTANDAKGRPMSLTWEELGPRVAELAADRTEVEERWAAARRAADALPDGELKKLTQGQDRHYKAQVDNMTRLIRNVESEYYMRPALATGCLIFALIGCPVGIWANRADYLSTFVLCFLPTVLLYYPLLIGGSNMGKDGKLPLGLACWVANIVFAAAGVVLTWRLLRR